MACYRRIRELREDNDLTQRQLASILDMPQPQYFRYEQGYRDIPTDILIRLAQLYHTSTDYKEMVRLLLLVMTVISMSKNYPIGVTSLLLQLERHIP